MVKVLFVNHKENRCGVYQFCKRIYGLVSKSKEVNYIYSEVTSLQEFLDAFNREHPDVIIYNYHHSPMGWLTESIVDSINARQLFIFHEYTRFEKEFLFFGKQNIPYPKSILLPKPLFDYENKYELPSIPNIGTFGLQHFVHGGAERLVKLVNDTFEEAVINILMPVGAYTGHSLGDTMRDADRCRALITNPKIILNITHDFLPEIELLNFLARNNINAFLYENSHSGYSDVTDYALSVKRPIALTNVDTFEYIICDEIDIGKYSLKEIMDNGIKPLEKFYEMWSTDKFRDILDLHILEKK